MQMDYYVKMIPIQLHIYKHWPKDPPNPIQETDPNPWESPAFAWSCVTVSPDLTSLGYCTPTLGIMQRC